LAASVSLIGCQSVREATGAAKIVPDEFAVVTKAPLILPPDYNLRPPQPGAAARNQVDPEDEARQVLFQDQAMLVSQLGNSYSDGEKLLLTKANALIVDPNIRRQVNADVGQEDQGPAFTQKVLFGMPETPAPAAAASAAPAAAVPGNGPAPGPASQ
jgi:Protein of unknown function (DUF3035)